MSDVLPLATLSCTCAALFAWAMRSTLDWRMASRRLERLQFANPHARLLGRVVEAKVYEGSSWERMVVVAVSWRGAVCVRPEWDMRAKGRWIHKDVAPHRVREVSE